MMISTKSRSIDAASTNIKRFPSLFVSHGSPMMAVDQSVTSEFLTNLGNTLPTPKAIIVFSAHFDTKDRTTDDVIITSAQSPKIIHDFYGFPHALYDLTYPASGDPKLASKVVNLLLQNGISAHLDDQQGWDHGVWIPLKLMYPQANIPIVQVSINSKLNAATHYRLGQSLRSLRDENILILGSGGISHNLGELASRNPDPDGVQKVALFTDWIDKKVQSGDIYGLLNYFEEAPYARFNHPTQEHFLPFFCFLGSCTEAEIIDRVHQQVALKLLALDAYLSSDE